MLYMYKVFPGSSGMEAARMLNGAVCCAAGSLSDAAGDAVGRECAHAHPLRARPLLQSSGRGMVARSQGRGRRAL